MQKNGQNVQKSLHIKNRVFLKNSNFFYHVFIIENVSLVTGLGGNNIILTM